MNKEETVRRLKYKIGDRLRVRKDSRYMNGKYAGRPCTVSSISKDNFYPYKVRFDDGTSVPFHANELESTDQ